MISPTPTRQPEQKPEPEQKKVVRSTPARRRAGQTPVALFFKAIFRPIFKGLYYVVQGIRHHKLVTLGVILLLLISITATTYVTTGEFPFGIGHDPFNFQVKGAKDDGGTLVQNWLYALRNGNVSALKLLDSNMAQPPDPNQLVSQYSQTQGGLAWESINVVGEHAESDTTVDTFVEVDVSSHGPGGPITGYLLWHFTTASGANGPLLLGVDYIGLRAPV